jgi:hypothetical protein
MSRLGVRTVLRLVASGVLVATLVILFGLQKSQMTPEKSVSAVQGDSTTTSSESGSAPLSNSHVTVNGQPVGVDKNGNGQLTTPDGKTQVQVHGGTTNVVSSDSNSKGDTSGNNQNTQLNVAVQSNNGNSNGQTFTDSNGYDWSNSQSSVSSNSTQVFSTNSTNFVSP